MVPGTSFSSAVSDIQSLLGDADPATIDLDDATRAWLLDTRQAITAQRQGPGRRRARAWMTQPSRRRRFAGPALIGVATAAVAAAVALALLPGSQAGHRGQGGVKLAAWSVIKERHGLVKVTIRELRDPAGLQKTLRAAGVPANVRFVHHFFQPPNSVHLPKGCLAPQMSDKAIAKLMTKIEPGNIPVPSADAVILRSSAIPHGLGMYLKAWAPKPGTQSAASLVMETDLVQATPQCTR
jgi:hypothetical protein